MTNQQITLSTATIHNPAEPRHFMRIKPVTSRVRIRLGDNLLAESSNSLRLLEVGRDFYDPVIYLPQQDVCVVLDSVANRTSHCPIKGEASYYSYSKWVARQPEDYLAWSYPAPFEFAAELAGLIAFNPAHVSVEETPL